MDPREVQFAKESAARARTSDFYASAAKLVAPKRLTGTLRESVNGDVACYLTFTDESGAPFEELGDFEICFQKPSPLGKRVRLEWGVGNVLADECQGNPDCGKSKRVALVERVQVLGAAAAPTRRPSLR